MSGVHRMTPLCSVTVNGQFEFVECSPMAGGMRAGTVREFDYRCRRAGRLGQVCDMHCAARIKM